MQTYDFTCNVCGAPVRGMPSMGLGREGASCFTCGSSVRMRSILHNLSMGLFGRSLPLPQFPPRPDLIGLGLSDWPGYAEPLAGKFSYTNTFYHREPFLDIVTPPKERQNSCDFLVSSDVFEHIPPPVDRAFAGAFALLKPGGLLVLTVPFNDTPRTVEHFPELHDFRLVEIGGDYALVNRTRNGCFELHANLVFHGGPGDTLEMRVFSRADTIDLLQAAGFVDIRVHDEQVAEWGIILQHLFGVPITARRPGYALCCRLPSPQAFPSGEGARAAFPVSRGGEGRDPTEGGLVSQHPWTLSDASARKLFRVSKIPDRYNLETGLGLAETCWRQYVIADGDNSAGSRCEQLIWSLNPHALAEQAQIERTTWAGSVQEELLRFGTTAPLMPVTSPADPYLRAAVVMMIKDEADIIGHNLRWLHYVGMRRFIINDNESSDGTFEILKQFRSEFRSVELLVVNDPIVRYMQAEKTTALFRMAISVWPDLHWVFPIDADEFLIPQHGLAALEEVGHNVDGLTIPKVIHFRHKQLPEPGDPSPLGLMGCRSPIFVVPPKVVCKNNIFMTITQGNHCLRLIDNRPPIYNGAFQYGIYYREFPTRSFSQFLRKIRNGGPAIKAAEAYLGRPVGGEHWVSYYDKLMRGGEEELRAIYQSDWVRDISPGFVMDPFLGVGSG